MRHIENQPNHNNTRDAFETTDLVGIYFADMHNTPLLTPQEEQDLASRRNGEDRSRAREELTVRNLRLVGWIAPHYIGQGIELPDLIQEGNIGLMKAADKFDARGSKFSSYSGKAIHHTIINAISKQATLNRGTFDSSMPLEDSLKDPGPDPAEQATRNILREKLMEVVGTLPQQQAFVITWLYGLNDEKVVLTLEKIGQQLGVTKQRAQQIATKALANLKPAAAERSLDDFLAGGAGR